MYCRKCGNRIPDDSDFCQFCGNETCFQNNLHEHQRTEDIKQAVISSKPHTKMSKERLRRICTVSSIGVLAAAIICIAIINTNTPSTDITAIKPTSGQGTFSTQSHDFPIMDNFFQKVNDIHTLTIDKQTIVTWEEASKLIFGTSQGILDDYSPLYYKDGIYALKENIAGEDVSINIICKDYLVEEVSFIYTQNVNYDLAEAKRVTDIMFELYGEPIAVQKDEISINENYWKHALDNADFSTLLLMWDEISFGACIYHEYDSHNFSCRTEIHFIWEN